MPNHIFFILYYGLLTDHYSKPAQHIMVYERLSKPSLHILDITIAIYITVKYITKYICIYYILD